jgi:hypothetical protein
LWTFAVEKTTASVRLRQEIDQVRRPILSDLAIPCPIQARRREAGWICWCHVGRGRMSLDGAVH